MYTPKPNGRRTRELNADSMAILKSAKAALVMALGYEEPEHIRAAVIQAWAHLEDMQNNLTQIEINCTLAARRGPYSA